ncbi:MAG: hypothetical protein ACRD82_01350, partial [Blastocatellia bacterium]
MKIIALTKQYRGVILFFLLLTCLDIPFPQLCGDEVKLFGSALAAGSLTTETAVLQSQPALPDNSSDSTSAEDDCCCFCCCTHVLPAPHFNMAQTNQDYFIPDFAPSNLPYSP